MTQNFHTPIINGDPRKNDAAIWNDPYGTIDAELSNNSSELDGARGAYPSVGARLDSLVLSGGNVATLANGAAAGGQKVVNVDSATGFLVGGRIGYTLNNGQIEYNTIAVINSAVQMTLSTNINPDSGGIPNNALITMISESEYQAAQAVNSGGTASATLPSTVSWLDREVNVKAFGAFGDGTSHLVGAPALAAAAAAFPLTQAAFTITAADEYDWCAIQEAVLTAGQETNVSVENVYIPAGSYKVNRTIVVPLVGGSGRSMTITGGGFRGGVSGAVITATASTSTFLVPGFTTIRQLHLVGADYANAASIAIRVGGLTSAGDPWSHNNAVHVTIDRVYFNSGFYRCISALYEVDQLRVAHCTSSGSLGQAVIYLSNDNVANGISPSAGVVIESCAFANNNSTTGGDSIYGVYLMGTEDSIIRNSVIRGYDNTIYLTGVGSVRNEAVVIEGIHSEINQPLKASLANRWTPNTAYTSGAFVRPQVAGANGWWYKCTTSGTSAATSIRTAAYRWTASARGTNEYYLELAAGGNPSVVHPHGIMVSGTPQTFNFAGALGVSQWGYADNDGLGFNTIYIRLSDNTDPDTKALHAVWTTDNEPVWPTTYGATVTDGGAVWTAYKRAVFCTIAQAAGSVNGGLTITSVYCDSFNAFIQAEQSSAGDVTRIYVNGCTVRNADMVYNDRVSVSHAAIFENSQLDGCIKPFGSVASSTNNQSSIFIRFCSRTLDYTGALVGTTNGVASWFTNEPIYSDDSDIFPNDVDAQLDPRTHSQITVSTGSTGTPTKVYVPHLPSAAFLQGLRGKTITITHGAGTDGLTVEFNALQSLLHGANAAGVTSLSLPRIGDSVTIRLGIIAAGTIRWTVVGSHGLNYVENAWMPTITGSTTPPTIDYTTQLGYYVRIGNMVFFSFSLIVNSVSGGAGNLRIGGWPLAASALTQPQFVIFIQGIDAPGTPISLSAVMIASSSLAAPNSAQDNASAPSWPLSTVAAGDWLQGGGFYFV